MFMIKSNLLLLLKDNNRNIYKEGILRKDMPKGRKKIK